MSMTNTNKINWKKDLKKRGGYSMVKGDKIQQSKRSQCSPN